MKKAGRSATYIFGVWVGIAFASGLSALAGYEFFEGFSPEVERARPPLRQEQFSPCSSTP